MKSKANIKKFDDYDIEDFLSDEFFVKWVKNPDDNTTHFWEKWLGANPEKRSLVSKAASIVRSINYHPQDTLNDDDYVEIFENIIKSDQDPKSATMERSVRKILRFIFSARHVAVLSVVGLLSWALYLTWPDIEKPATQEIQWITKTNPKGQKASLKLKDGTKIHLNSNTTLSYPADFTATERFIKLEHGEAFFDVEKERRPFKVITPQAEVEVLGTSFNINRRSERSLTVALVEGTVKVSDYRGNQVMLAPSEMLQMEEDGTLEKSTFSPREITGWIDKYLVFKDDNFVAVVRKLEDWYGIDILTEGDFPNEWAYSGIYHDESLQNILEGIRQTSGITYSIRNKTVVIKI